MLERWVIWGGDEIRPELRTFSEPPYFVLDAARDGVVFQAHAGGVTTSNSGYPRSELREMTNAGADNAAWSTTSGVHSMTVTQEITHLPVVKPHVVAGQIHDASDDVVMIRLEGAHLFVEGGGQELADLNANYQLGTRFTVRLSAAGGRISIYYDDLTTPKVEIESRCQRLLLQGGSLHTIQPESRRRAERIRRSRDLRSCRDARVIVRGALATAGLP